MQIENCTASLEKAFFDYLTKRMNDAELCKRLSQILSAADLNGAHKEFEVSLIDGKNDFAGMCVYPDLTQFSNVVTSTLANEDLNKNTYRNFCDQWFNTITKYCIEIDKNCFDRTKIDFNPQELTAMLLHEMSHVAYSDRMLEKFYRAYRINRAQLSRQEASISKIAMGTLYIFPGIIACSAHKMNSGVNGLREEYLCDKVFGLKEYQEHLVSALDKILKTYGTSYVYDDGTSDKKITASIKWCNLQVNEIEFRRDALKRDIVNMAAGTHSRYTKNAIITIINKLGIGFRDKYTGNVVAMESIIDGLVDDTIPANGFLTKYAIIDIPKPCGAFESAIKCAKRKYAMESLHSKPPKLPSGFSIDEIDIEIDKVENHQDRIYVLDLIYAREEQINDFIDFYGETSYQVRSCKSTIDKYRRRLEEMRSRLLSRHVIDNGYRLFVKSPAGYEG